MKDNQAKYPQLRFKGFTDPWEQRKLGAITDSFSGGTPTAGKAEYYGGEIPFIRSGEISSDSTELFITDAGLNNSSAKMVEIGDILYALYGATSGETSISRINGAINQAILAIRPTKGDDPYMIVQWLKKQKEPIISTYLQGGQGNLSGSIVKDLLITLPKNKDEQAKVGSFFKQLDQTITLHQRKLAKLKELKQGYLQKLFPKNGSKFPQLRFAGFADAWEKRKLGELTKISSAARVHKDEWTSSGVRFFRSSDVVSLFKGQVNTPAFISENLYDKLSEKSGVPSVGDILITGGGSIGIPYVIGPIWPLYFKDADLIWLKSRATFNSFFLFYYLQTPIYRTHLRAISHIGTIAHFTIEQAEETPLKITVLDEQNYIASILTKFDDLIAATQCKLDLLKKLKKGYLQKMFC
ncbi:restriction endonuclease subunit S [Lactiplantibacillus paraplantarum]|uniref:Restriction endonuclease subunit S n=1 Tax=Lactiplantibacillus paraplantarum TaxID=60520 RepID=A0A4Q9XXJ0_9LACO|nr:restriction endonuclease subunit S [Lactiplantibacillus paraplantarum]